MAWKHRRPWVRRCSALARAGVAHGQRKISQKAHPVALGKINVLYAAQPQGLQSVAT